MEKVSIQNAGFYPGCSPVGAVDNSNSATEKFRTLMKQELKFQLDGDAVLCVSAVSI